MNKNIEKVENPEEPTQMNVKMTNAEKARIKKKAQEAGMGNNVSEYMRFTAMNAEIKVVVTKKK